MISIATFRNAFFLSIISLGACDVGDLSDERNENGTLDPGAPTVVDDGEPIPINITLNDEGLIGETNAVSFGAVFPKGSVTNLKRLVIADENGVEVPSHLEETVSWYGIDGTRESVRAARVTIEFSPTSDDVLKWTIVRDAERNQELEVASLAQGTFRTIQGEDFPMGLEEPSVYVTFSPEWLGLSGIRGLTMPVGTEGSIPWFDDFMVGSAGTAINDVPNNVVNLIDLEDNDAWLFDRTYTLYTVYARTGDVKWLRHAHRSAAYYITQLEDGFFTLAPNNPDLKYSYGQSLLVDYMMTGDERLKPILDQIAAAGATWNEDYVPTRNFFTERHQAYSMSTALAAFEVSGSSEHRQRLDDVVKATFGLAGNPTGVDWPGDACLLHTMQSHEGSRDIDPVCSPWMSSLLAEVVWRYYLSTEDEDALVFLGNLGEWTTTYGIRQADGLGMTVPWYLASSVHTFTDDGPYGDWEHTCDVATMVARGAYARQLMGQDWSSMEDGIEGLVEACEANLDHWHRPDSETKSEWRLQPARKFNWIFGSAGDLPWLMKQLGK